MKGRRIECWNCDGHGQRRGFDGYPDECRTCCGNGYLWKYPCGAIASYFSGPFVGREAPEPAQ